MVVKVNGGQEDVSEAPARGLRMQILHDREGHVLVQFSQEVANLRMDADAALGFANMLADQARAARAKDKSIIVPVRGGGHAK